MELGDVIPAAVGVGRVERYYPILFEVVDMTQDGRVTYYLDDIRAWASGDISSIAGMERQVIMSLAQAMLNDLDRIESGSEFPPPQVKRIENLDDDS